MDFLMVGRGTVIIRELALSQSTSSLSAYAVGNQGDGQHFHSHVTSAVDLRNSTHTNSISTKSLNHVDFGRRLVTWSAVEEIARGMSPGGEPAYTPDLTISCIFISDMT